MAMDDSDYCSDCKKITEVVYDHAVGDSICAECGLVLESRIVDETAEWRTFANDDGNNTDPVRVGAPSNPFLDQSRPVLETTIVNVKNPQCRNQIPNVTDKSHRLIVQAFGDIDELCERLGVNKIVKDLACDLYSKVCPFKTETRRDKSFVAACVHIASQRLNQSRTLKEMRMATGGLAEEKKIVTAKNSILKLLNEKFATSVLSSMELGRTPDQHVNDYLKRFAYEVKLNNHAIRAAQEMLKNCEEHYIRRTPKSIAAGIVYVTCLLCGNQRTARDISTVANTSEGTIKKSYKDLYPYLKRIVPSWFASESDIMKLYVP